MPDAQNQVIQTVETSTPAETPKAHDYSTLLTRLGQNKIARTLAGIGFVTTLYGCVDQNGNQQTDFIPPAITKVTDRSIPTAPVDIRIDPQTNTYNLAFLANQTQVFEITLSESLWQPTYQVVPQGVDPTTGKLTGTNIAEPGLTMTCAPSDAQNPTNILCTVKTDATFNLGTNAAKMIPFGFFVTDNARPMSNNATFKMCDTVSAVAPTIPTNMPTTVSAVSDPITGLVDSATVNFTGTVQTSETVEVVSIANPNPAVSALAGLPTATMDATGKILIIKTPPGSGSTPLLPVTLRIRNSAGVSPNFVINGTGFIS
jgi:hypothetical protein